MKLLTKSLIFLSLAALTGGSIAAYTFNKKVNSIMETTITNGDGKYVMSNDNYSFELNEKDLKFKITKGSVSWNSGEKDENDTTTITARERRLTNPVVVYVLSNSTNSSESSFSVYDKNICETTIRITPIADYLNAHLNVVSGSRTNPDLNISFDINYKLMDDGLQLSITGVKEEEAKYTLSKLSLYPGFGMTYQKNNSKYLIPEGSGAEIDLSIPSKASSELSLPLYDKDIGVNNSSRTSYTSEKLSIPMFANYDDNKTMITTIENGSEYADLNVKLNGMVDDYNNIYYRFTYKEIMTYEIPSVNADKPITNKTPQSEHNKVDAVVNYHLYDEKMEYYDIAKKYQEYLINKNMMGNSYTKSQMRLEFLMGENKKALFGKETFNMTTTSFIKDKAKELKNDLGTDISFSVKGYTKGGYGDSLPNSFPVDSISNSYGDLGNFLQENNMDYNFVVDTVTSFKQNNTNNALNITQNPISSTDYINNTKNTIYRVNPGYTASLVKSYEGYLNSYKGVGFDFTSIGNELFSTYHREGNTRTSSIKKYQEALKGFTHVRSISKPNYYVFPYFENYLNAPTSNGGYLIETSSIPFLQMVFSGYKTFYSKNINLNYLGDKQLLELIDFNVNPSYLLTQADTMNLIDSPYSSYIFSSKYSDWETHIKQAYNEVVRVLKQVEGQKFLKRELIASKIYKNTYENGKVIIVNYSSSDYDYNGHNVPSMRGEVF